MPIENQDDNQLIAEYLQGREQALEILINKYLGQIYGFVYRLVGKPEEAEDITQEVFVKVWRSLKKFDKEKSFKPWLFKIAKNTAMDFLNGEIIAKDDKSITIKIQGDSGSKIVFFSDKTEVSKFASGSLSDLQVGQTVFINGTANTDGNVTAQTVQLRPAAPVNQPANPPVTP